MGSNPIYADSADKSIKVFNTPLSLPSVFTVIISALGSALTSANRM